MSKPARIFRTAFQIVVGLGAAVPAAAYQLNLSAAETAKVGGIVGCAVILATMVHNAVEGVTIPTLGGGKPPT